MTVLRQLDSKRLRKYLLKNPAPAVIGPGYVLYVTDRHHLARALAGLGVQSMAVSIQTDWSRLSLAQFWQQMLKKVICMRVMQMLAYVTGPMGSGAGWACFWQVDLALKDISWPANV